jgi:hypothetical protein
MALNFSRVSRSTCKNWFTSTEISPSANISLCLTIHAQTNNTTGLQSWRKLMKTERVLSKNEPKRNLVLLSLIKDRKLIERKESEYVYKNINYRVNTVYRFPSGISGGAR